MSDVKVKVELQSDGEDYEIDIETDTEVVQRNSLELLRSGPFTNFSIEEILKPDFGSKKQRSVFGQFSHPSPKVSPKEQDENRSIYDIQFSVCIEVGLTPIVENYSLLGLQGAQSIWPPGKTTPVP